MKKRSCRKKKQKKALNKHKEKKSSRKKIWKTKKMMHVFVDIFLRFFHFILNLSLASSRVLIIIPCRFDQAAGQDSRIHEIQPRDSILPGGWEADDAGLGRDLQFHSRQARIMG